MISVIGSGPAGGYLSYLLAGKGKQVSIYEEHNLVGSPIQCTGFTTSLLGDIIDLKKEFLVNRIGNIHIKTPGGEEYIKLKEKNVVLNRTAFDTYLTNLATQNGAVLYTGHKFVGMDKGKIRLETRDGVKIVESGVVVGADGPVSSVAKEAGLFGKREFWIGAQGIIKGNFDPDMFSVYLGDVCPGFFAWIVPENEKIARVGLATKNNPKIYYDRFVADKGKQIGMQGGIIPVYNPRIKTQKQNIYLLGDAATQVKSTTGGGIISGMLCAQALCEALVYDKDYEKLWRERLGKELYMHRVLRNALDKFSQKDYDELLGVVSNERVKEVLGRYDREFPSKLIFRLLISQPKFLKFISKVF